MSWSTRCAVLVVEANLHIKLGLTFQFNGLIRWLETSSPFQVEVDLFIASSLLMKKTDSLRLAGGAVALLAGTLSMQTLQAQEATSWLDYAVTPISNPVWFEDARITTEVRPIFIHHSIDDGFITAGGNVEIYALQLRYAITEKLAFIAVKDGYVDFNPKALPDQEGYADIAAGFKYNFYRNDDLQLLVTPGITFEFPWGNRDVFQGNGDGVVHPFVSVLKGYDEIQFAFNAGLQLPLDGDEETAQAHYSAHAHWEVTPYVIPVIELNGFYVFNDGTALPGLTSEGFDVINFGAGNAGGEDFATFAVGVRSKVTGNVELGVAWEKNITGSGTLFDTRFTADLIYRF